MKTWQIKEVVNNILNNAFDAVSADKGRIRIKAENGGDTVKISIRDNGHGIDAQTLPKIFEPFYSTKSKGTGLGLSVCRQIISLHNGTIEVESEPGHGATFSITLPDKRRDKTALPGPPAG